MASGKSFVSFPDLQPKVYVVWLDASPILKFEAKSMGEPRSQTIDRNQPHLQTKPQLTTRWTPKGEFPEGSLVPTLWGQCWTDTLEVKHQTIWGTSSPVTCHTLSYDHLTRLLPFAFLEASPNDGGSASNGYFCLKPHNLPKLRKKL